MYALLHLDTVHMIRFDERMKLFAINDIPFDGSTAVKSF